jgi:hypothetical protein
VARVSSAWKLRVAVYGLLLVVVSGVLTAVLTVSSHGHAIHTLSGRTSQGAEVAVNLDGRRLVSLNVQSIAARCGRRRVSLWWAPTLAQTNVGFRQTGSGFFTLHEWPQRGVNLPGTRQNAWMRARLSRDGRRIDGVISYHERGKRGRCASGPIRFGVSR